MTTAVQSTPMTRREVGVPDMVTLEDVSWESYELLVRDRDAANRHHRITYDRGRMVIMLPLPIHERVKGFLGQIIELATLERGIPRASYGSTTFKDKVRKFGLEPDECYYIGREPDIDPHKAPNPSHDPVPDIVIEVEITYHPVSRPALYATMGVPELWRYDGQQVEIVQLGDSREYEPRSNSQFLPFLSAHDLTRFVALFVASGETTAIRAFHDGLKALPKP